MKSLTGRIGFWAGVALLLLGNATPAQAQYMRLTTDNPTDNTRLRAGGTTLVTVTLDTNHDRNGSLQTCNSHSAACGAPSTGQPLNMFGYTIALKAVGGTVVWGAFTASDASYTDVAPQAQTNTEVEINQTRPTGTFTAPGLATLGTLPVTILAGTPRIDVQIGPSVMNPFGFGTGFGTVCDGFTFGNTYVVGNPADPCGALAGGFAGDWFDWDGAGPPALPNNAPVISVAAVASAAEGTPFSITATANDPDVNEFLTLTVSGRPPDLVGPGVSGPPPLSLTLSGVPGFSDAGTYVLRWTATDHFNATTEATTSLTIANTDRIPALNPIADMGNCGAPDQAISGSDPDGDALTFTKAAGPTFVTVTTTGPTTGTIHLAISPAEVTGSYGATVRASDGTLNADRPFTITISSACRAPVLDLVADMTVREGQTSDQTITASDPDGTPLTFSRVTGPIFMMVTTTDPGTGSATGAIHLAPGLSDAGTYAAVVRVADPILTSDRAFSITALTSGNQCPTANAGSIWVGRVGVPLTFDGSASSDPDGNPLTYAWDFDAADGITVDATGVTATHTYVRSGTFLITLTVTDNGDGDPAQGCSRSATTRADISAACQATVFNGYDTIRLNSGKPFWFAYVQPAFDCYDNPDVNIGTFSMVYGNAQIFVKGKTSVGGDKNMDGIPEIKVSFSKEDLRHLFAGLPNGHNTVTVKLTAGFFGGGTLSGTTQLDVFNNGSFTVATVAPNPLNPSATLTYVTTRPGAVRIDLFNVQGQLVRRLVDDPAMAAGAHEAIIDGRGSRGEKLPSGVYFIRGTSAEGEFKHLITILK